MVATGRLSSMRSCIFLDSILGFFLAAQRPLPYCGSKTFGGNIENVICAHRAALRNGKLPNLVREDGA